MQKTQKQNTTTGLRTCNNILAMTKVMIKISWMFTLESPELTYIIFVNLQPLHSKTPSFIGDKSINPSWKEAAKPSVGSTTTATGYKKCSLLQLHPCCFLLYFMFSIYLSSFIINCIAFLENPSKCTLYKRKNAGKINFSENVDPCQLSWWYLCMICNFVY